MDHLQFRYAGDAIKFELCLQGPSINQMSNYIYNDHRKKFCLINTER